MQGASRDPDMAYEQFLALKDSEHTKAVYKHYRNLAKPTGLGYPGGLGPDTFITYAAGTFGVKITRDEAVSLQNTWKETFPEMPMYFNWINNDAVDLRYSDCVEGDRYHYTTPFGLYRPNTAYCPTANGNGLQSPSAEGAKLGVIQVVRSCYDPTVRSILGPDEFGYPVRPNLFIHDEIMGDIRIDDKLQPRIAEIQRLMVQSMVQVTPDVRARSEAALMWRWDKEAEAVYDSDNNLIPWIPKAA